jgi:site-specific recombinase XerD
MASIRERTTSTGETTWAVLYRHGGKQASKTYVSAKKAAEVKALIDALGPDRAFKALAGESASDRLTVAELAEKFLTWKARDVEPRTIRGYRRDVDNWITPWLGHLAAEHVDETDVQKWVDHMADQLAPKSVADRHMLLHSMYQFGKAKSRRLVTHNPCLETELPKRTKKPPKGTTVPEFRAILSSQRNPDARDLILFLGETGWRWSEGACLPVRAVEDDGRDVWVTVVQTFQIVDDRQVVVPDKAKSYAAFRRVRLFPESAAMVRRRMVGKAPTDFVFTNSRGAHWNQNTFLRDTWPRLLEVAGVGSVDRKPTPHWLRHMHVAVCGAAGVPMHEIQRRIGHEHYSTTVDVYGGMIGDMGADEMDRAAAIMAGKRSAPSVAEVVVGEVVPETRLGDPTRGARQLAQRDLRGATLGDGSVGGPGVLEVRRGDG